MALFRLVPGQGLALIRARLTAARAMLATEIPTLVTALGTDCASALSSASPRGADGGGGTAPAGDASGPLADSFVSSMEATGDASGRVQVSTTQPTKLKYVRYGTGIYGPVGAPIRPVTKKALYWRTAPHPMRSVKGQKPNDFVSPVLAEIATTGIDRMDELAIRVADLLNGGGGGA